MVVIRFSTMQAGIATVYKNAKSMAGMPTWDNKDMKKGRRRISKKAINTTHPYLHVLADPLGGGCKAFIPKGSTVVWKEGVLSFLANIIDQLH